MPIQLSIDQWPLVFTRLDGAQTLAELDDHIREVESRVFAKRQRFAQITFLKGYSRDSEMSKRAARWFKESEKLMREYCVGVSHISASMGFRFVLSTVFLIKPLPVPHTVAGNLEDALSFVRSQAAKHGLSLPSNVQRPWPDIP